MKFGFLCHQLGYQFFGPVNRDLIRDGPLYPPIPLNVLVDFVALVTHGHAFSGGSQPSHLSSYYVDGAIWFQW
jgi:hypothetical protein